MKKTATAKKKAGKPAKKTPGKIISAKDLPAARVENPQGRGKCVIVCDHASNRVPKSLSNLGLKKADLQKHIAWDPGTEDIGRYLSQALDSVAVLASYSRLVVDLNRGEDHKECMRDTSDHIRIPGNIRLTAAERQQRLDEIFWPYHDRIEKELKRHTAKGAAPVLISIHSFTPKMDGFRRPWHIGVLWNREEKIARKLVRELRRNNPNLVIGENEPYSLKEANFMKNTISTHAESRGLPYVILEFRQDLVDTKKKAQKWAGIFLESLLPVLADPGIHTLRRERA